MNPRPSGCEPDELPGCSTPRQNSKCKSQMVIVKLRRRNYGVPREVESDGLATLAVAAGAAAAQSAALRL